MGQTTDYRLMMAAITYLALKVVSSNRECHDDAVSLQYPSSCLSTLFVRCSNDAVAKRPRTGCENTCSRSHQPSAQYLIHVL